jgi:MoxR-like ATPase
MSWALFTGSGQPRPGENGGEPWRELPNLRSWRQRATGQPPVFDMPDGLADAVNAALHLRRPLLLSGGPGSGKSTLVDLIAAELALGPALRWHITSKSTLGEGLYEYDALGRLHATQEPDAAALPAAAAPENFVTLGPLGTALASARVRAVLIDEIDKSDLDLPGDLLDVMERGEFKIPVLARVGSGIPFTVTGADGGQYGVPANGVTRLQQFPVIVFTSNEERTFPSPFLRRCVRFEMPTPDADRLARIVSAHLGSDAATEEQAVIIDFAARLQAGDALAINQILEFVHLVTGASAPDSDARANLRDILLKELSGP